MDVPITFCTHPDDHTAACEPPGCVTDANPRSCESLTSEVSQLIDVVYDALAEAAALADIMTSDHDPTPEILEGAGTMALALGLGRRALQEGLDELQRRHPDQPAHFVGARIVADMEKARRRLVDALLDEARRLIA